MKTTEDYCMAHQNGDGLYDDAKAIANKVIQFSPFTRRVAAAAQGPRKTATARFNKFLDETQGNKVVKVELGRKPIVKPVHKALDLLSLGGFSKKQKELKYDDVYHQFIIVTLDNGKKYKMEKNEVVIEKPATDSDYKGQIWDIPLKGKDLTLKKMIDTASKGQEQSFWQYSGDTNNCQKFSRDIIERNDLMPEQDMMPTQDAKALVDTLPAVTHAIPNLVTNAAAIADRFVHGDGVQRKKKLFECPF
jgi:hypothetical protein